jgi:hypothetical protein
MRKLRSARDHLLNAKLGIRADRLLTFAEKGRVTSYHGARNRDFALAYDAHLILTDFEGELLNVLFVMLQWLHRECPSAPDDALQFHLDILDTKTADLSLLIPVTDTVTVTEAAAGTWLSPDRDPDALALGLFPDSA